jgi:hypothetical protein
MSLEVGDKAPDFSLPTDGGVSSNTAATKIGNADFMIDLAKSLIGSTEMSRLCYWH